jgi:hypothetical protein
MFWYTLPVHTGTNISFQDKTPLLLPPAVGILEGEEAEQERRDSLEGLLADLLTGGDVEPVLAEILEQWENQRARSVAVGSQQQQQEERLSHTTDISDQLHQIMEQKMSAFSAKKVEKSQEELQMKAAILASYSQVGCVSLKKNCVFYQDFAKPVNEVLLKMGVLKLHEIVSKNAIKLGCCDLISNWGNLNVIPDLLFAGTSSC